APSYEAAELSESDSEVMYRSNARAAATRSAVDSLPNQANTATRVCTWENGLTTDRPTKVPTDLLNNTGRQCIEDSPFRGHLSGLHEVLPIQPKVSNDQLPFVFVVRRKKPNGHVD